MTENRGAVYRVEFERKSGFCFILRVVFCADK